ncbi:phBC6A51 family helix-turn-helix protein [Natroniella sp. ANB-PHB2]|uniref:phBC6A51 family helix-turn-helix protein n=1 Tax=Natroniella sp. ANB-PHB2 TaxID=3384444 RepID=UPI0038D37BFA
MSDKTKHNETDLPLSAKQMKFAQLLANPDDRRSRRAKIREVGVSPSTAYRWLKDDSFLEYLNDQIERYTEGHLATAWNSLIRQMKRGDTKAIKLFFELKGKYKQEIEVTEKRKLEDFF